MPIMLQSYRGREEMQTGSQFRTRRHTCNAYVKFYASASLSWKKVRAAAQNIELHWTNTSLQVLLSKLCGALEPSGCNQRLGKLHWRGGKATTAAFPIIFDLQGTMVVGSGGGNFCKTEGCGVSTGKWEWSIEEVGHMDSRRRWFTCLGICVGRGARCGA